MQKHRCKKTEIDDMAFFREKFSILFAIYVALYFGAADGKRNHSWTHDFCDTELIQDRSSLISPGQVYGCCDTNLVQTNQNKFELACTFIMENTNAVIESQEHIRICNFSLTSDVAKSNEMYLLDDLIAITNDRAVLKMQGTTSHMLWVLNFANCTVSNSYTNDYPMSLHAPSNNKFDIIFYKNHAFEEQKKIEFDIDGNIISKEQLWLTTDSNIVTVVDSNVKGRLVVDEYKKFINDSSKSSARIYSVANDGKFFFSICCNQDDLKNVIF